MTKNTSKLYGVDATIIIFVFVLYCIVYLILIHVLIYIDMIHVWVNIECVYIRWIIHAIYFKRRKNGKLVIKCKLICAF